MKRTILNIICVVAAVAFGVNASAQQIMEGQAEVKNLSVARDNGRVKVQMNVDISNLSVGADETVILTPVISKDNKAVEMPAIEVMGRRAWIYWRRNGEQTITANPLYADREAKRAERKAGKKQSVAYSTELAFEPWMKSANVSIKECSKGCTDLVALGENPLQRVLHDPYKPQYLLAFLEPEPEPVKVRDESHSAYINFKVDKYEILEQYKNNATELASILSSIDKVKQDEDLTITSITIEGWASPEATQAHNQRLSQNRANSLSDYVSAKTGIERSRIEAIGQGEDWKGLREAVVATPRLLDQQKVLAIIDRTDLTLDQKDKMLSELVPETIYQRLMNEMYPKLRRNDYRIVYNVRNFNLEEARALIDSNPRKLSLGEMYKVAGSYQKGSKEYNHVMQVAAKTYPNQPAAAVNAAAAALAEGDANAALALLAKADQDNATVQLTAGYAYAKMGNNDKARELWQKAADKGSAEAKHNLAELAKSLE